MEVTILTEDWYNGFTPRDERFVSDVEFDLDDEERGEYADVLEDEIAQSRRDLAWLQRDEDDSSILMRWNQPDDVLDESEQIEANDERGVWTERMTAFRRAQLHRLLTEYLGADYASRNIVLRWGLEDRLRQASTDNRWVPVEQMNTLDWINAKVEEKGSQLSGFASCAGTVRSKLARKRVAKTGEAWWKTYNGV